MMGVLKEERIKQGLRQKNLAKMVGCSQQLISKAEQGIPISVIYAKKIAEVLGMDWKDIYE
ncbi:helix-turn-helix transcriptional regulator [Youxingia wuxianensis]|nr:helix-turn-helix transcriptional regulator [Youxingia wuxianensis]